MSIVNIATHLKNMAQQRPEQRAILYPVSRDLDGRNLYLSDSYRELDQRSDFIATGLRAMGIGRGVRTVLMVPPSPEFFSLTFALFKVGAVPVLVDPGMGFRNLGRCLAEAEPEAFIGVTQAHVARWILGWGKATLRKFVSLRTRRSRVVRINHRFMTLGDLVAYGSRSTLSEMPHDSKYETHPADRSTVSHAERRCSPIAETNASDQAAILFTSGSTGVPKGVVYSHGTFAQQIELLKDIFQITPGEIDLCTFPLFALFAPALGMTAVVPRMNFTRPAQVDPREVIRPVHEFGVTNLFGSPALLNTISRYPMRVGGESPNCSLPSVRRVISAGAPVSADILDRLQTMLAPGTQVYTPYGATESLPVAVISSREILEETRHQTAQGAGTCVGRPVAGTLVSIIHISDQPIAEWNDSLLLPEGEIGEIVVRGPQVTQEYFRRPDLTALAKIPDPVAGVSRHRMGDVGYFDPSGRLWFCGRKSQRVITAEGTYFTEPIEGIFNSHPRIFRTALVGVRRAGKVRLALCVERESGYPLAAIEELTRELLELGARFRQTQAVRTILYHDSFPVDVRHNSKIFREKLAVWAAKQLQS